MCVRVIAVDIKYSLQASLRQDKYNGEERRIVLGRRISKGKLLFFYKLL